VGWWEGCVCVRVCVCVCACVCARVCVFLHFSSVTRPMQSPLMLRAFCWDERHALLLAMACCACLWGVVDAVAKGPRPALFADSLATGSRSRWFSYAFMMNKVGRVLGPALTILAFRSYGDSWTLPKIRVVFLCGMVVELLGAPLYFLYSDSSVVDDSSALPLLRAQGAAEDSNGRKEQASDQEQPGVREVVPRGPSISTSAGIGPEQVPFVILAYSIIVAFGSGMTIKFFPLFWKEDVGLTPAQVQGIFLLVPIVIAMASVFAVRLSRQIGRICTIISMKGVGVACLVLMVTLRKRVSAAVLIAIYLARTGSMNATIPLEQSTLMDFVSSKARARWKSLQSITSLGWCGSAVLGGILADAHGYEFTFLVTAFLQGLGTCLLVLIMELVPMEHEHRPQDVKDPPKRDYGTIAEGPVAGGNGEEPQRRS